MVDHPTQEEAVALCLAAQAGDVSALDSLLKRNAGLSCRMARRGKALRLGEYEDILQTANVGMIQAALRFDPTRDIAFATWAVSFMKKEIHEQICRKKSGILMPRRALGAIIHNRRYHPDDLSRPTSWATRTQIELAIIASRANKPDKTTTGRTEVGLVADNCTLDEVATRDEIKFVMSRLGGLNERQQMVLCYLFGLRGHEPIGPTALGRKIGLTYERVRQIEAQAIATLRVLCDADINHDIKKRRRHWVAPKQATA